MHGPSLGAEVNGKGLNVVIGPAGVVSVDLVSKLRCQIGLVILLDPIGGCLFSATADSVCGCIGSHRVAIEDKLAAVRRLRNNK